MIKTNYHPSEHICPYCDNGSIRYSNFTPLHYFRMLCGARKRYCPKCHRKWQIKTRYGSQLAREIFLTLIVGGLGFGIFLGIINVRQNVFDNKENVVENAIFESAIQGFQLLEQGGGGKMGSKGVPEYYKQLLGNTGSPDYQALKNNISSLADKYEKLNSSGRQQIFNQAKTYLQQHEIASDRGKEKLIQEARQKLKKLG